MINTKLIESPESQTVRRKSKDVLTTAKPKKTKYMNKTGETERIVSILNKMDSAHKNETDRLQAELEKLNQKLVQVGRQTKGIISGQKVINSKVTQIEQNEVTKKVRIF